MYAYGNMSRVIIIVVIAVSVCQRFCGWAKNAGATENARLGK